MLKSIVTTEQTFAVLMLSYEFQNVAMNAIQNQSTICRRKLGAFGSVSEVQTTMKSIVLVPIINPNEEILHSFMMEAYHIIN